MQECVPENAEELRGIRHSSRSPNRFLRRVESILNSSHERAGIRVVVCRAWVVGIGGRRSDVEILGVRSRRILGIWELRAVEEYFPALKVEI